MSQSIAELTDEARFPATPTQERLWRLEREHGDSLSRNIAVQWELRGRFSESSVEAAFQAVVDRHEILRTAFEDVDGRLIQRVVDEVPFHLGSIDLRSLTEADCQARIRQIAVELAGEPFDMTEPGQLRACLVRFETERAALLIATHYGVFDGYSIKILGREIGTFIAAAESGEHAQLPELELQYGDYALWREACAESDAMVEARDYWHARLETSSYFELPTDRARDSVEARQNGHVTVPLPDSFRADLDKTAKSLGSSHFALGAAVMAASLHAATGQSEVGFTTCVAGREETEVEDLIGVFVNPVVLQFDCAGASLRDLIGSARRIVAEALAHGEYPLDDLAEELGQPLDPRRTPFVTPFFSLQSVFVEEQDYGPVRIVSVPSHTPAVTHDIGVQIIGRASGWNMMIDYDAALFDEDTIRDFAAMVTRGFEAAFDHPETAAAALAPTKREPLAQDPGPVASPSARYKPGREATPATLDAVAAVWAEFLPRAPERADDDFFDLGGHSLPALRMLARIEQTLGVKIDIGAFFDDPTLGGLAKKLDSELGTEPVAAERHLWSEIDLRQGAVSAPLIVSLNQPFLYHGLAITLQSDAKVINLHLEEPSVLEGPDTAVAEDLLEGAARQILVEAQRRRLVLMGHCVDGTLCLQIAERLAAAGQRPDLVAMIDSWKPGANKGLPAGQRRLRKLSAKSRRWIQNTRQLFQSEIGWTEFLSRNKLTRALLERLGRIEAPTELEQREWSTNARLVQLVQGLPFQPYRGEVALFATGGQDRDARPRLFGWSGILPADTPIYDLPGWHEYALKQHGVARIAEILDCRIGRATGAMRPD